MDSVALIGLALLGLAQMALGGMALGRVSRPFWPGFAAAVAAVLLSCAYLLAGAPARLPLLIGPPGTAPALAIDGLSGFFLLLHAVSAAALLAATRDDSDRTTPVLLLAVGAATITLLAGDGFLLVFSLLVALLAAGAVALSDRPTMARGLAIAVVSGLALLLALGAAPFPRLRALPPDPLQALSLLALLLIALVPRLACLPRTQQAASGPANALLGPVLVNLGTYLAIRLLFDLAGPAPAVWWGLPLLLGGAAAAAWAATGAVLSSDIKIITAHATLATAGLTAAALGLALSARAVDLAPLASLALAAALILSLVQTVVLVPLSLAAGAVQRGAGSRSLDRLGGLIRAMPVTSLCVLGLGVSVAALPPSAGFAAWWMLFQALIAAPRIGGMPFQLLVCLAALLLAVAIPLQALAAVRLIGIGFLGRPRSPRAAAAEETGRFTRGAMITLTALGGLLGVFPAIGLRLAAPALRQLLGLDLADRAGPALLAARVDSPGYGGLAVVLLLGLGVALAWAALRRAIQGHRSAASWDGGYDAPPPWLPFGDPITQLGADGLAALPRRYLAALRPAKPDLSGILFAPTLRGTLAVLAAALLLLLIIAAVWEQP